MRLHKKEAIFIVLALIVHSVLQLLNITRWHIWHDESFSAMLIEYNWAEMFERAARDVHPPLYYVVLKIWGDLFGLGEFALRSLSAVLSLMIVVLAYVLIRRLFTKTIALWTLPFLAVGPFMVRYGHEMRMYTLAGMFILINLHLFVSIIRGKRQRWFWAGYILTAAAAIYTHYYSGLILGVQGLYLLYMQGIGEKQWWKPTTAVTNLVRVCRQWGFAWVGIFALLAPWIPIAIKQVTEIQGAFWIRPVSHESFYSTITSLLFFRESYPLDGWHSLFSMIMVAVFVMLMTKLYKKEKKYRSSIVLLGFLILIPMALLFISSLILQPTYFDRYFVLFSYAFYALLGIGLYFAFQKSYWNKFVTLTIASLMVLGMFFGNLQIVQYGDFDGDRARFTMRDIMSYVNDSYQPGDALVTAGLWTYFDARFYNENTVEVQVYLPYDLGDGMGNVTLVYNRDDLIITDLENSFAAGQKIWYFTESSKTFEEIPETWVETGNVLELGYAKVAQYIVY